MSGRQCDKCGREHPLLRRGMCSACYNLTRERQVAYGRWRPDRVDAEPVRAYIQTLRNAGVSLRRIAVLAGVSRKTITGIMVGQTGRAPAKYVTHSVADRIRAIPIPEDPLTVAADHAHVPALGAQRRLRALVASGWTMTYLGEQLGVAPRNFGVLIHHAEHITARRHRDVAALFDRLQVEPGPSNPARIYARKKKWAMPFQWDEESIDRPEAKRAPRRYEQTRQAS